MRAYLELTKPRITWLILVSTGLGYFFGLPPRLGPLYLLAELNLWRLFHTLLGVALVASGTAALNQWWEWESDARMRRTSRRPLPSGRVTPARALSFGLLISLAGCLELFLAVNALAAALTLFTLLTYLLLYTPLKRRHWLCTAVGAVPGAMPPVIGYAAALGRLDLMALVLFAILFLWQFPHFYAIAWLYREDYARAGIRMLPVVEENFRWTVFQMLLCVIVLIPVSVLPSLLSITGYLSFAAALLLGVWYLYVTIAAARDRNPHRVRVVFTTSIAWLPLLYTVMVLDRIWL